MPSAIDRLARALIILLLCTTALAGPPLSIDDPGILDLWQLEMVAAVTSTKTSAGDTWQLPLIDMSLGVIEDHLQLGVAFSRVHVHPNDGNSESDTNNPALALFPVNPEYGVTERWRLNGEVSYVRVQGDEAHWFYGAAVGYAANSRWDLLFEVAGTTDSTFNADFVEVRAGFDVALSESFHLLFSMASDLRQTQGEDELDLNVFFGVQYLH